MSPHLSDRTVRKKRKKRRSRVPKLVWAVAACLGAAAVLGGVFYVLHRFDHLSTRHPVAGYVQSVNTLLEEYRRYYGEVLEPGGEVAQAFVRANEQMLRGDFEGALVSLRRVSRDAAVPSVFTDEGVLYAAMRDERQAVKAFQEVFVRDPSYTVPQQQERGKDFAAILAAANAPLSKEAEPNNERESATLVRFGVPVDGEIADPPDVDSFKIVTPPAPRDYVTIEVNSASTTFEPGIRIYDSEWLPIEGGRVVGGPGKPAKAQLALPANHTIYVQVSGGNESTGRYVLRASSMHAFDAYEPNDSLATATPLRVGSTTHASILDGRDLDTYVVESPTATSLSVEILEHSHSLAPAVTLFGPDKNRLTVEPRKTAFNEWLKYQFTAQPRRRYYIQVSSERGSKGEYTLKVE